jgi:peptidoglycan hydrolase-like protein with peptidoglycan-binding domain
MIQTRLLELGLYRGPIDGIWGRGSRAGLKAFKEKKSLENPEKWDKETQVLLFGGTGEAGLTSDEPDEESISSGEILLNPGDAKDARIIQKRLAELGLYKGPIDGIWGKGSQAGLKAFKEQNSIGSPDRWNKETQLLLFHK